REGGGRGRQEGGGGWGLGSGSWMSAAGTNARRRTPASAAQIARYEPAASATRPYRGGLSAIAVAMNVTPKPVAVPARSGPAISGAITPQRPRKPNSPTPAMAPPTTTPPTRPERGA